MQAQPQLLIFGIDGAPFGLTEWMMRRNLLPNLAAFKNDAGMAPLISTWPPHTAPAWPTIFNGRMPGEHGIYMFWDCQAADYRLRTMRRDEAGVDNIFDFLAHRGKTVGLQNIPMFHPASGAESYQIGWPLEKTLHYIHPPRLVRELAGAGGLVRPDISCMYDGDPGYYRRAMAFIGQRGVNLRYLLKNHPVDVAAVVFTELDRVGHHYWHGIDPSHPQFGSCSTPGAIIDTYRTIDGLFGEAVALVGDDCAIAVVSDHGMGPGTTGVRIHHLLEKGGFLEFHDGKDRFVSRTVMDGLTDITELHKAIRFQNTLAYMPVPGSFALNINLHGRQELGIVSPADKKAVLKEVSAFLTECRSLNGEPLFAGVIDAGDIYGGRHREKAPDLLLVPHDPACMLLGDCGGPCQEPSIQTGLHRMEGLFMLRSSRRTGFDNGGALGIEAVASLLLASMGIQDAGFPALEGKDWRRNRAGRGLIPGTAWSEGPNAGNGYSYEEPTTPVLGGTAGHDEGEWLEIGERLRRMGYL